MKNIFLFCLFVIAACQKDQNHSHPYSFYYWKTTLALDQVEQDALEASNGPNLYVRLFDVDKKQGEIVPIAKARKDSSFITQKNVIPVVFITQRSFVNIKTDEIELLAKRINGLVDEQMKRFGFSTAQEIQIDCDWTASIKQDYFQFLKLLKKESNKQITSTLRLHQVQDKENAGIPPVDKVYLMCYSTSSPLDNDKYNSILEPNLLKNYLFNLEDYPIQNIAVALPIYSWGIVENHLGKHKIINGLTFNDLDNSKFKKINTFEAEVLEDGFYFGFFLNKGFKVKVEEISDETIKETFAFLEDKIGSFPVIYYQLDSKFVSGKNLKP